MRGEGMAKDMRADLRRQMGFAGILTEHFPESLPGERPAAPGQKKSVGGLLQKPRPRFV
jgi:hypothetical protein